GRHPRFSRDWSSDVCSSDLRVAQAGLGEAMRMLADAGLAVSSLCRGGFLTAADKEGVRAALQDNRAAIREAAALGTDRLIMVVGARTSVGRGREWARWRAAG